ncbi:hypothetical protein LJC20_02470 [Eubacteriales bacterium OttesenSCG-928-M02]|nr:hypothetical protein [Eubacteriales bacterium OttesenSCG-928-M02]
MKYVVDPKLADRYGVNAALVAQVIWKSIRSHEFSRKFQRWGKTWMRSSQKMFTASLPYLSHHQIRRALERLMKMGVIIRGEFSDSRFDRTSWYTFTQYGQALMEHSEEEKKHGQRDSIH